MVSQRDCEIKEISKKIQKFWKNLKKALDKCKKMWYNNQVAAREVLLRKLNGSLAEGERIEWKANLFLENWTIWKNELITLSIPVRENRKR